MSLLRKVLAGLAVGAGNYLSEKAKLDAQAAREEILMNREIALQAIKKRDAMDVNVQAGEISRQNTSHGAEEQRATNVQTNKFQADREAADDERGRQTAVTLAGINHQNAVALKAVDFKNDVKAKKVAAQLHLTLEDFRSKVSGGEVLQDSQGQYFTLNKNTGVTQDLGRTGPVKGAEDGSPRLPDPSGKKPTTTPTTSLTMTPGRTARDPKTGRIVTLQSDGTWK